MSAWERFLTLAARPNAAAMRLERVMREQTERNAQVHSELHVQHPDCVRFGCQPVPSPVMRGHQ